MSFFREDPPPARGLFGTPVSFRQYLAGRGFGSSPPPAAPPPSWRPQNVRPTGQTAEERLRAVGPGVALMAAGMAPGVGEGIDAFDLGQAIGQRDLGKGIGAGIGLALPFMAMGSLKRVANAAADTPTPKPPIKAYHGSPHDFDRFDMSKIGTGEGNQSYGRGLYFSEAPEVANSYRGSVSAAQGKPATINGRPIDWNNPREAAAFELWRHAGDRSRAADFHERSFNSPEVVGILRSDSPLPQIDPPGRGYEVAIHADPEDFLDWDSTLEAQSSRVRDALSGMETHWTPPRDDRLGRRMAEAMNRPQEVYKRLAADPERVATLRERGIKGIRYFDQGSRHNPSMFHDGTRWVVAHNDPTTRANTTKDFVTQQDAEAFVRDLESQGTRNYVVFDDSLVEILRKYGIAGLLAANAAGRGGER